MDTYPNHWCLVLLSLPVSLLQCRFIIVSPYGVICAAIRRRSVSFLGFTLHSNVTVFASVILPFCHLKYPYFFLFFPISVPSFLFVCLFGFYGISTFVGYLMTNTFYTKTVLFLTIQLNVSTQFNCQNISFQAIPFSQTVLFKTIQFSISIFFVYTLKLQSSSISNNSV